MLTVDDIPNRRVYPIGNVRTLVGEGISLPTAPTRRGGENLRTDIEIIEQTNSLAREFYRMMGYSVPATHKFYDTDRVDYHPQEATCWAMACRAQIELTSTDPDDALSNEDLR